MAWRRLPALVQPAGPGRWSFRRVGSPEESVLSTTAVAVWECCDGESSDAIARRLNDKGMSGVEVEGVRETLGLLVEHGLAAEEERASNVPIVRAATVGFDNAPWRADYLLWSLASRLAVVTVEDPASASVAVEYLDGDSPPDGAGADFRIGVTASRGDRDLSAMDVVIQVDTAPVPGRYRVPPWAMLADWWPGSVAPLAIRAITRRHGSPESEPREGWVLVQDSETQADPVLLIRLRQRLGAPRIVDPRVDPLNASDTPCPLRGAQVAVVTGSGPNAAGVLMMAWECGALPVFCGPAALVDDFNQRAMVVAESYPQPSLAAGQVEWLLDNERDRALMLGEPLFYGNRPPAYASPEALGNQLWRDLGGEQTSAGDAGPPSTKPQPREPVLTIGMATFNDFDGVYFSVQALRLYHPEATSRCEIVVLDNNPGGESSEALESFCSQLENCRYLPVSDQTGTAVRDRIFRVATTPYVLCMDSHVLLCPGALKGLLDLFDHAPQCRDLIQGPLVSDNFGEVSSHFKEEWRSGMYGVWAHDERADDPSGEPFEIPMQGLGVFACRRDAWPGFNPDFRGFGGEEGYIHEKFRQQGQRVLCLPALRWLHRFGRPKGVPYNPRWEDRIRNYLLGWRELGLDDTPVKDHFAAEIGAETVWRVDQHLKIEADHPFWAFDAVYCINLDSQPQRWEDMSRRFRELGVVERVRRYPAVETADSHHIGCTLSHRAIIELAWQSGWESVLVFEDDAIFRTGALFHLQRSVAELASVPWSVFYLGYTDWWQKDRRIPGFEYLESGGGVTSAHAIAYHRRAFERLLQLLPATADECRDRIERGEKSDWIIDQLLSSLANTYLARPPVATQPPLRPYLKPSEQAAYPP